MSKLEINMELCMGCDICIDICANVNAISKSDGVYMIDNDKCELCKACTKMCISQAIIEN